MSTFLAVLVLVAAVALYRTAGGPWHGYVPRHPRRVRVQLGRSHR